MCDSAVLPAYQNFLALQINMKTRLLLTAAIAAALVLASVDRPRAAAASGELGIGSDAPALDIEHWIQDGNGFFKPVTEFEKGKVYVVEFWATWCGPCISSMPHLAELQNKYRGENVQIVSVSDETVDEVKDLLAQENADVGKTFAEITSAYCLTTDPDRSVYRNYMEAADQQGIPTSFIVGKTGVVEWIGHPMDLDEPLEAVVNDSWDREAFKKEMELQKQFEQNMQKVAMLASAERFEDAIKLVDQQREATKGTPLGERWSAIGYQIKLSAGMVDDEVLNYFRSQLAALKGEPYQVGRFAYMVYGQIQQGVDVGPLASEAVAALKAEVADASADNKPLLFNTLALLSREMGDLQAAIEAQQAAIDSASSDRDKKRLTPMLEALKEEAAEKESAE